MSYKEIFGKRFKDIRKNFGLTQDKMAEIAGIEPQSISKIESGKNFPLLSNLEKIANKLSISPEEFFKCEHKLSEEELEKELFFVFKSLKIENKEKLVRIAKILDL